MNKAFIFPGQGSQQIGMGKDFYDNFSVAKEVYQEVDDALEYKLSDIIFNGTQDELSKTIHTQPALMATSMAIMAVILKESGKELKNLCKLVAGHSLGEYSALCASGVLSITDTAKLLKIRANAMQNAVKLGVGSMAACIAIDSAELQKMINSQISDGVCEIANDNVEGQIVISGHDKNIDIMINYLKNNGFRAIKLNVSAPFHCSLIKDAEETMQSALDSVIFNKPTVPLICNVDAKIYTETASLKQNLVNQICASVKWRQTMHSMHSENISKLTEIGSGTVLSGLARRSPIDFTINNVSNITQLDKFLTET